MLGHLQAYPKSKKILENDFQLPKLIYFNPGIKMKKFLLQNFSLKFEENQSVASKDSTLLRFL